MALQLGAEFGCYEILSAIGAGGMGEVYRARDRRLHRDVAIKILPQTLAHDAERLARFEREARTLAALNHPNITQIHGLEEGHDGVTALVMELVEGPTLAGRIAEGPLPLDEALGIARQIAEAAGAAHEKGIIHRDLKPSNVKVRSDGVVKVLDFGLAKALELAPSPAAAEAASPTITSPTMMTRAGVILGTAAYMSPEQARGRAADKRSDIWAFGCVLYEMLTARRPFDGEDTSDTLAAVLRGEPDWTALPQRLSGDVVALIKGCLEKDPRRRVADLSTALFVIDQRGYADSLSTPSSTSNARRAWVVPVVAAVALIATYANWMITAKPVPSPRVARFTIPLPTGATFSNTGVDVVAISQDGSRVVYVANGQLYLRPIDRLDATAIRGTEGTGAQAGRNPFFSPDGRWIGFWQGGQIKKVSITGGPPQVLCAAENPFGATWTSDDMIVYGQSEVGAGKDKAGIWRVSSNGGEPHQLVKIDADEVAQRPQILPGRHAILFTLVRSGIWDTARIVVQSLDSGSRRVVLGRGTDARYVAATGHLVYALDGTLYAVPFDHKRFTVTLPAVALVEGVAQQNVVAHFALSAQGALVYVPTDGFAGAEQAPRELFWVDRQGLEVRLNAPPRAYFHPRLSPDGQQLALEIRDQERDIWIWDVVRETLTRLTLGPSSEQYPVWTPDGRNIIFGSSESITAQAPRQLLRRPFDGTGNAEQLTQVASAQFPSAVTPDGTALVFRQQTAPSGGIDSTGMDLFVLPLAGDRRPRPLLNKTYNELNAELSPDGHWLAYQSDESGRFEIYVRPFPNVDGGKKMVSTNGGRWPLWARTGRELFFESHDTLMRVPVTTGAAFDAGTPTKLFAGAYFHATPGRMYDVDRGGQRFLMIKEVRGEDKPVIPQMILVQNWVEELKQRVPTRRGEAH